MKETIFMRANEVAAELGIAESTAYRMIQRMNAELKKAGYITISGRVDRRYFHDKLYATKKHTERNDENAGI